MGVIAVDTDQVRAIAQYCVEDAAALREVRGAVDRAWGVGGLPPTVLRLRGECDIPLATVSRIAHELESEADKLRHYADRIDGIESVQWTPPHPWPPVIPLPKTPHRPLWPFHPAMPGGPRDLWRLLREHQDGEKHPDPLWGWLMGAGAGAWGAIQGALKKVADLAKRAEEILAHLIAALTKLATGFVRTADTMQRAVTHWVGGNVVDPILHFPQDWDAWMRHDEHRGIMGPLGTAIDWIGSREHDIEVGLGKLLLLDGKQNSFQDILLNAIPVFGEARGAYRLGMAYKGGDFNSMAWEAAGLALPFFGGAALSSFGKGASAVERGVMTAAGKAAEAVPFFQDLWSHRGDILHDLAKGAGGLYEGAKGWAKDRWGDITRASRKGQDIIERGWDNFLRDVTQLGKNFVSAAEGIGRTASRDARDLRDSACTWPSWFLYQVDPMGQVRKAKEGLQHATGNGTHPPYGWDWLQWVNPSVDNDNCRFTANAVDDILDGKPSVAPEGAGGSIDILHHGGSAAWYGEPGSTEYKWSQFRLFGQAQPEGAHGFVFVLHDNGTSHILNWVKRNGEVYWVDGQKRRHGTSLVDFRSDVGTVKDLRWK